MKKLLIFITSILLLIFSVVGMTFAWLTMRTSLDLPLNGSIFTNYFHCGIGSENDPYVITRPKHLYNLTMLYQNLDGFDDSGIYFQVGYDLDNSGNLKVYSSDSDQTTAIILDMSTYSEFIPIGTVNHPFQGIFNGNNITIDSLTIVGSGETDIGTFGYVADTASIKNLYLDNITIDITGSSYTSHIHHTNTKCYVGYIAGHIDDANCFENVYVNNCSITGETHSFMSDWGYFGYCKNAGSLDSFIAKALGDTGWGGSFNSKDYTALGYSIRPTSSGTHTKTVSGEGGYVMAISASTNANPENNNVIYRLRDGSYVPLKFNDDRRAANSNTGYLVGSNVGTGVNASPKISSYRLNNIGNALSNTAYTNMANTYKNTNNITYDDSKLEVLTYYNGNWVRIRDEHNYNNNSTNTTIRNYTRTDVETIGLQRYADARNALQESLTGSSYVHGIHFDNNQVNASNKLTIPANTAIINGQTYSTTYEVPKGSINFNLKEAGYITFFAGTYNSSQVNLNFFSLNQVFRNGGTITNIKQITEIYNNTATTGEPYVYKYSDGTYSAGTRGASVFNLSTILSGNAPVVNMLYYFELPVNQGEYAMGVAGSTQGAYMMYLDIGTNGNSGEEDINSFGSIEYRNSPDTIEDSILIIRYSQTANLIVNIEVYFDKTTNTYNIITSQNIPITVAILNSSYNYKVNGTAISSNIGTYNIN